MIPRVIAVIMLCTIMACDEHVPDGPGPGDKTPPGLVTAAAWDIIHMEVVFDEPVTRWSAENTSNYFMVVHDPRLVASSDETLTWTNIVAAALHEDLRTVSLTTLPMTDEPYRIQVVGVTDASGNSIPGKTELIFAGSVASDVTPPELVYRMPAADAPGISTRCIVTVGFSEEIDPTSIFRGLRVLGEGAQITSIRYEDLMHFSCSVDSLLPERTYTVVLRNVKDLAGNIMPEAQWTFDTQSESDTDSPTVVSSYPAKGALNVELDADLTLNFSEPMDPFSVKLRPRVESEGLLWTRGGRKLTLATTWIPDRQYTVQIRPGEMSDQAGNAGTDLFTLTFSTGDELETGAFAGTITGDPGSSSANDPTGGLVFAGVTSPNDLYTSVVGIVAANNTYEVSRLPNGTYFPFYVADSNRDGIYQPKYGDAVGMFGVSNRLSVGEPLALEVEDARISNISFEIYDPTSISGLLTYTGIVEGEMVVGLFSPEGFDPSTSTPVLAVVAVRDGVWDYVINTLNSSTPIPDGSYCVMAFLDGDENSAYDPSIEPMGVYGGATPIAVDLSGGKDASNVSITLLDPASPLAAQAVRWKISPPSPLLQRIDDMLGEWREP